MSPLNEHKDMIAITAYYKLQAQVDELQRQLDNARTDWLCDTCEGRGCEAENQNAVLLAELEEQARLNGKGSEREAALLAKVETLQRENAALWADRERLDWLTDALDWVELGDCVPTDHDAEGRSRLDAWRLAIDAARKEQPCQS